MRETGASAASRASVFAALCIAGASVLGLAAPAWAQPNAAAAPAAPQTTTATYQDWVVRCEAPADKPKVCEIAQGIQARPDQGLIAQVVVGRPTKTDPIRLIVELPAGVWLPTGAQLQAGEKGPAIALAFKTCPRACFADAELKPDQIQAMKSVTGNGTLTFADGAQKKVQLPVSFNGFAAALNASLAP